MLASTNGQSIRWSGLTLRSKSVSYSDGIDQRTASSAGSISVLWGPVTDEKCVNTLLIMQLEQCCVDLQYKMFGRRFSRHCHFPTVLLNTVDTLSDKKYDLPDTVIMRQYLKGNRCRNEQVD